MKKWSRICKRVLCLSLAVLIGWPSLFAQAVSDETKKALDKAKADKAKAEQQMNDVQGEKKKLSTSKTQMTNYLKELENQVVSLEEEIEILEGDIRDKQTEVERAQQEVDQQYRDMKKRIQFMYENQQDTMITYLICALTDGITAMLNQVEYASKINTYDRNMLQTFQEKQEDLEVSLQELSLLKEEVEEKKQEVAEEKKAAGSKLDEFERLLELKEGEISDMEELVAAKTQMLNELLAKAEREEAQARLAAAQAAANAMNGGIIAADANISHHVIGLSDYELLMLAVMIYCEAGNQGMEGQLAVGYVIMNRVRSSRFPNSLEAVLKQAKQFEPYGSGKFDLIMKAEQDDTLPNKVTASCWEAAKAVVNGTSTVGDSLFFRTWRPVPNLIENLKAGNVPYWIIRDHVFYYYWTSYSTGSKPKPDTSNDDDEDDKPDQENGGDENQPKPDQGDNTPKPEGDNTGGDAQKPEDGNASKPEGGESSDTPETEKGDNTNNDTKEPEDSAGTSGGDGTASQSKE